MTPLRRRTRRAASVLFAAAVAGGAMAASTTAAGADEEAPPQVQKFDAADFASAAAELPNGMAEAIDRDLGISAEEYLANAAAAKNASDIVEALETDNVDVGAAAIDEDQNVTIYLPEGASSDDRDAASSTGAKVKEGEPDVETSSLPAKPQDDFRGGYAIVDQNGGRCSAGFSGVGPDDSTPAVLTAGHCGVLAEAEVGDPWYHLTLDGPLGGNAWPAPPDPALTLLGETATMAFNDGNNNDAGVINNINTADWTLIPEVSQWGGGAGSPLDGSVQIYDTINAVVGAQACKSGSTSGWTCGEIVSEEETVTYITGESVTGFIFDACMLGGDSGGSIVVGNYALGVDSGSSEFTKDCANWDTDDNAGDFNEEGDPIPDGEPDDDWSIGFAITSGTVNAEQVLDNEFDLSIFVGTPEVSSPEAGAEVSLRPTISGSVDAAEGATITVELTGPESATLTGTVASNGEWSVRPDENLAAGEYTFTATASHTANGASSATTGGTAEGSFNAVTPPVETLAVESPTNGQVVESGDPRPSFSGTGHPGAEVTLTIGDDAYGSTTVGDEGNWTLKPDSDLPIGVRFDATLTQVAEGDEQSVTVSDLGIKVQEIAITNPEDGSEVTGDVVFEGTAYPGSKIGLLLEPQSADSADAPAPAAAAASGEAAPAEDDVEEWQGELEIDEKGNWSFTPAEPLPVGEYKITAFAEVEDGDPELSTSQHSVMFTVVEGQDDDGGDDDGGDGDLPDTGTSNMPFILLGIGLVVAGGAFVAFRAIRGRSMA